VHQLAMRRMSAAARTAALKAPGQFLSHWHRVHEVYIYICICVPFIHISICIHFAFESWIRCWSLMDKPNF
jgi:hypothetical protein